ncbi:STAS domain-containing protein [Pseudonocardia acaciae]|uniref:STAS domain-containing protein n=1 Tax=Pseudonocardia acaciae TaxID=551276 RepID=UPI0014706C49|nr:STAS domain-containing protein [Pseudonocardia acaciae]
MSINDGPGVRTEVVVQGEVDLSNATMLDIKLTYACSRASHGVVVDLARLDFVDAAGLCALTNACRLCRIRGLGFEVVNPSNAALRAIRAADEDRLLPLDAAVA